jgi:hypothetical protein
MPNMNANFRWRSNRRCSSERSAAEMRREHASEGSPKHVDKANNTTLLRQRQKGVYTPPAWLIKGALADYSPEIGAAVTRTSCIVTCDPFRITKDGAWVTYINGVRGWVACEALSNANAPIT